jgi:serine/threonine-protein kinase
MNSEDSIRRLLIEMMESGQTAEQVCVDHPELLEEVRSRSRWIQAVDRDLESLFPSGGGDEALPRSALVNAPSIAGFEEIEFVGRGGMGVVYKARQTKLRRTVAIKMLLPGLQEGPRECESLLAEASAVAALQHPNIVQVFEFGIIADRPYFTMEFLEGGTLAQKIGGVPLSPTRAAELVVALAAAVSAAHEAGIVHRDLKPGNILFASDGTPKIADFSLARQLSSDPAATLGFGTPSYMAPEQARGTAKRNERTVDIYSLGAVLYDMLTRRAPFRADTPAETYRQLMTEEVAPPSRLNARVPRDLETICITCLRKDPERRYATAQALADDLQRFLRGEPILARPVSTWERARKWVRRHPRQAAAWSLALLTIVATIGIVFWVTSQRLAITRAVADDLAEVRRLQHVSDWRGARDMLERADLRLSAGGGATRLKGEVVRARHQLDLVDRLSGMRLERAASREVTFDRGKWWRAYRAEFIGADLLVDGDDPSAFARRISDSPIRPALLGPV